MKSPFLKAALTGLVLSGVASMNAHGAETKNASDKDLGQCYNVNSCKGTGMCSTKEHSCGGRNTCKGKGWIKLSKADCEGKKGQFVPGLPM
jgi:hypothetical protein